MPENYSKSKRSRKAAIRLTVLNILIVLVVLALGVTLVVSEVTNQIVRSNIANMEELAEHDENSLYNSLNIRWTQLEDAAKVLKKRKFDSGSTLCEELKDISGVATSADYVMLLSDDGTEYRSSGLIAPNPGLQNAVSGQDSRFVERYNDNDSKWIEIRKEMLIMGVPIDYTHEGAHFSWLLCRYDISTLEKELKIKNYQSEGFSSVIDREGNYIVNVNRTHSVGRFDNFFDELKDAKFEGYSSIDEVRTTTTTTTTTESKSLVYNVDGEERIMVIKALGYADWFFVSTVPTSAFSKQTRAVMQPFTILLVSTAIVLALAFALMMRQKSQKEQLRQAERIEKRDRIVKRLAADYERVEVLELSEDAEDDYADLLSGGEFSVDVPGLESNLSLFEQFPHFLESAVHPDDRRELVDAVQKDVILARLAENPIYDVPFRVLTAEERHWYKIRFSSINPENPMDGIVVGLLNIDAEKESEQGLEEALNLAQSANRSKTTFLNNMSHDIRTPMNAIIGFTKLAQNHLDSKEQVGNYLEKISQSSDHLLSLINDVLDMSRIESGKMNLNEKEENLPEIIHSLHDIVQAEVNAKQLDFFIDTVDVNDENIVCDKLRLNQVLLNVLSNAIKYTPVGGSVIVRIIEKSVNARNYGSYQFRIRDTGIGMDREFLKTIFDPFTRVNSSTVSGIQGTGLGMAITKNIVDLMGGKINISSEPEQGTEVVIDFDFKLAKDRSEPIEIPELKGLPALIVDDDSDTAISVAKMTRDIGMHADWCTSGREAVLRVQDAASNGSGYKLIIIDWMMPGMNGVETAKRIRKEINSEMPIIISSAYDWSDIEDEARDAGVTAFVSKPLFPSDLHTVLRKCVGSVQDAAETAPLEYDFTGKKLLLVEDNEMNREIATEILEEEGFIVDTAEDGSVAYEKMAAAKSGDYDLVLMDVQMPIMDGYTATGIIRELRNGMEDIPIIALSANAFEEDRLKSLDAGMDDHISKPIDIEKLKATLARFL